MRLTRDDWLAGGFELLKELGSRALTIDGLCARLDVTKGSFYHHFANREVFFRALLEEWERRMTDELIDASSGGADFVERNRRLTRLGLETFDPELEVAIRAWALEDEFSCGVQERVDRRRIAYLGELFGLLAGGSEEAEDLALIRYAFTVGAQNLRPALAPERYSRLFERLERWLEGAARRMEKHREDHH